MVDYKPSTSTYSDTIKVTETTDKAVADVINTAPKRLIENDTYLKGELDTLKSKAVTTDNIGTQTVAYAASAGSVSVNPISTTNLNIWIES